MACDIITESLIKGIIVTYSRTGITLQQIANVYYDCVGENWHLLNRGEGHAIQYLDQINGILSIRNEKNELLWYVRGKTLNGEKRGQIYRPNYQPKSSDFDLSTNPHGNAPNTCTPYNDYDENNNNNFRNARTSNYNNYNNNMRKVDRNNNGYNGDINGNYGPRNGKQPKYNTNRRARVNGHSFGSSINNDSGGSGSSTNTERKTTASLYGYDLVGDDFFMEMARIDLQCSYTNWKQIQRCGLCISGQYIRDATDRLKRFPNTNNMKIIVNLGTVDILHGRELNDMCQDYMDLVKVCYQRNIQIVITTLAPIANQLHIKESVQQFRAFNDFLIKKFAGKHQVIDITECMTGKFGNVFFDCYQGQAIYASGSNKPHLLWNRIGRQRILKAIKAQLRF